MGYKAHISVNGLAVRAADLVKKLGEGTVYVILADQFQKYDLSSHGLKPLSDRRTISNNVGDFVEHMQLAKEGLDGKINGYISSKAIPNSTGYSLLRINGEDIAAPYFVYGQMPKAKVQAQVSIKDSAQPAPLDYAAIKAMRRQRG